MILAFRRFIRKWLYNAKLRNKILFTYLALIILPLGVFQLIASEKVSGIIVNHVTYSARQGFEQTYSFISYRFERVEQITDMVATNPKVSEVLAMNRSATDLSVQMQNYQDLKQTLKSYQDDIEVSRVLLYLSDDFIFANETENFLPLKQTAGSACFERLRTEQSKLMWCSPDEIGSPDADWPYIHVIRSVRNPNNYMELLGQIRMDVEKEKIQTILGKANVVKNSVTYLQDRNHKAVLTSGGETPSGFAYAGSAGSQETAIFKNGGIYYLYRPIPSSQWTMITEIPLNEVVEQSRQLRNDLLVLLFVISSVAYFIAYALAVSVTRRISQLSSHLKDVQHGSLIALPHRQGEDEIGELIQTYNYMIDKISQMNREQYKLGQEMKSAELKALQSQINPHFLYNTLDMINWMANRGMNTEIRDVVKALSRFYKVSLSNGKDIITLREEIRHVTFYAQIQNIRFENKIAFDVQIPEELLDVAIPKITLQPLVENAIMHGILGRAQREGTVRIEAREENGEVVIAVHDNGVGMNPEQLKRVGEGSAARRDGTGGYGTTNVMLRLRHYFGEPYGLTFHSVQGEGTTVEIRIPRRDA